MDRKLSTISCVFVLLAIFFNGMSCFELAERLPASGVVTVDEEGVVTLYCRADDWYEWCTFTHVEGDGQVRSCDFEWKRSVWNITDLECDLGDRVAFVGDYNNHECAIRLRDVSVGDGGKWTCQMEAYHSGQYRGYGKILESQIQVDVIPKLTTTTTTTTTTTSAMSPEESTFYYDDDDIYDLDYESDTNFSAKTKEEGSTNLMVLLLIPLFLILALLVLTWLYYKRKFCFGTHSDFKPVSTSEHEAEAGRHTSIIKEAANVNVDTETNAAVFTNN